MKFIKIKDGLLESINGSSINTIVVVNDKDDLSVDDNVEFINDENVAFGIAKVKRISVMKIDFLSEDISGLIVSENINLKSTDHIKIVIFDYNRYPEPKSISSDTDLDVADIKIYADGGSRGNPGPSASGYVILTQDDQLIKANGVYLGITTNNQAEYKSIKFALEDALELGARNVSVYMDSMLVVNQLKGTFKIKNEALFPIYQDIKDLVTKFNKVSFTHVPRELNKLADAQVNIALDNELKTS